MTSSKYTRRLAALLMASAAILPAQSPSALASGNRLAGTNPAVSDKPATMSEAEYRALMLRSDALNEKYGPLRTPRPGKPVTVAVPTVVADDAFAWRDFGIGAAA